VKHWPILRIFGMEHHEETWRKWLWFCPPHFNTVALKLFNFNQSFLF